MTPREGTTACSPSADRGLARAISATRSALCGAEVLRAWSVALLLVLSDFFAAVTAFYGVLWLWRPASPAESQVANLGIEAVRLGLSDALEQPIRLATGVGNGLAVLTLSIVVCAAYALFGLYARRRSILRPRGAGHIVAANFVVLTLCITVVCATRSSPQNCVAFAAILQLNILLALTFRAGLQPVLRAAASRWGVGECRAVLLGSGRRAHALAEFIEQSRPGGIRIAEHLTGGADLLPTMRRSVETHDASMVICADETLDLPRIMKLIRESEKLGVAMKVLSPVLGVLATKAKQPVDMFLECPLVHFSAPTSNRFGHGLRRALFLCAALLGFVILLPLMLIIAVLIKLTSRGPVLFTQERIGLNRKPFRMYKFRTMYDGAERDQRRFESRNRGDGVLFKVADDPRITPLGRILRTFSIDELPQLINVIKGEMAVIGPRPLPRRDYRNYYEEWHYSRHAGRQGLTCLWQVSGRVDLDFQNMCILDVYYLRNQNPLLDLQILLRTPLAVVAGKGAC